jgi:hypothetical protein
MIPARMIAANLSAANLSAASLARRCRTAAASWLDQSGLSCEDGQPTLRAGD